MTLIASSPFPTLPPLGEGLNLCLLGEMAFSPLSHRGRVREGLVAISTKYFGTLNKSGSKPIYIEMERTC